MSTRVQGASVMHDEMMEGQVLGGIMSGGAQAYRNVEHLLKPSDFMVNENGLIYQAMGALAHEAFGEGEEEDADTGPFDLLMLRSQLLETGDLETVGGLGMLQQLDGVVLVEATLIRYARRLKKMAFRRNSKENLLEMLEAVENPDIDEKKLCDQMRNHIETVADEDLKSCGGSLGQYIHDNPDTLDYCLGDKQEVGWWTGWHELDALLGGLKPGKVYVIGGGPGDGKSAIGINLAVNVSRINDIPTSFYPLEMGELETVKRINTSLAEVSHDKVKQGALNMFERERVKKAHKEMEAMKLNLYIPSSTNYEVVEAQIRRDVREKGTKVVVLDYLQLIDKTITSAESRQVAVGKAAVRLKQLAVNLNICIVELAQYNRDQSKRESPEAKRPVRADLRESGDVENNADVVALIFRPERCDIKTMNRQDTKGKVILIVDKQRDGAVGDVNMVYKDTYRKFDNADGVGLVPPPVQMRGYQIPEAVEKVMAYDASVFSATVARAKSKDALGVDGPSGVKVPDGTMREYRVRERCYFEGYR